MSQESKSHRLWFIAPRTALSSYTGLDPRYNRDRLLAITGVMKRIARHRGYSRGRELGVRNPSDLLCKVKEHAEKPSQFVAPSWSWAALNMGENCQVATTSVKFRCYKSKLFSDD